MLTKLQFSSELASVGYSHNYVEPILVLSGSRIAIDDAVVEERVKVSDIFKPRDGEFQLACMFTFIISIYRPVF
jgi:hypothetical protein